MTEETMDGGRPPARRPTVGAIVVAAALAALAFGFALGRDSVSNTAPTLGEAPTTERTTGPPPVTPPPGDGLTGSFTEGTVSFTPARPGHALGVGVTEYLGAPRFQAITVGHDGRVWVGGPTGLMQFDPIAGAFSHLTRPDGSGPLDVRAIAVPPDDTEGSLWVATDRGLSHWDGTGWSYDSRFSSADESERDITGVAVGSDGTIWLATIRRDSPFGDELSQIHRARAPFTGDVATATSAGWVTSIAAAGSDLWVVEGSRLWRYSGAWQEVATATSWWGLQALAVADDGTVWVAGGSSVMRWDGAALVDVEWEPPAAEGPGEGETRFEALAPGPAGAMWALVHQWNWGLEGTYGTYLVRLDGESSPAYRLPDLADPFDLSVGPAGDVWIAGGGAVLRFDGTDWTEFRPEDVGSFGWVSAMATDANGEPWMAGEGGIMHHSDGEPTVYGRHDLGLGEPALAEEGEYWVITDPGGGVWGGMGCRAARFSDGQWDPLPVIPGMAYRCGEVQARAGPNGALWMIVADWTTSAHRFHNGAWTEFDTWDERIDDLIFGADGTVWATGIAGLLRYSGDGWETVFGGLAFRAIAPAGDGSLWAVPGRGDDGGEDAGDLWQYVDGGWNVTHSSLETRSLATAPDGTVWALQCGPGSRAVVFNTATGRSRWVVESSSVSAMAVGPDGTVWLGGEGAIYRVDPLP